MKNNMLNQQGTTLIEMIVTLALVIMLLGAFMSIYWFAARSYEREEARANAQYDTRMARQKIVLDIRDSVDLWENLALNHNNHEVVEVWGGTGGGGNVGPVMTPGTSGPRLYLEKKEEVEGTLTECKTIYYIGANQNLYRQRRYMNNVEIDTTAITEHRTQVEFTAMGNGLFKVEIRGLNKNNNEIYRLSTQCRRRAE